MQVLKHLKEIYVKEMRKKIFPWLTFSHMKDLAYIKTQLTKDAFPGPKPKPKT